MKVFPLPCRTIDELEETTLVNKKLSPVRLAGVASASRAGKNRSVRMSKSFVAEVASASRAGKTCLAICDRQSLAIVSSCVVVLQRGTRWLPPTVQL